MIKVLDKVVRKLFAVKIKLDNDMQEAIVDGIDVDNYFEEVMGAALDIPYDELLTGSLPQYINASLNLAKAQIKLEYVYKKGAVYEWNKRKYVDPVVDSNGQIPKQISERVTDGIFSEYHSEIMERMQSYVNGPDNNIYNFVSKNEWAQYFDNIDRVYIDEELKSMVVMQVQVISDVINLRKFIKYSPEAAFWNPEFFCKDEEMNFLKELEVKKFCAKRHYEYPLPKKDFVNFVSNKKRSRVYVVRISERMIGFEHYFYEQLTKIENKKVLKEICEYKLDYGLVVINPVREESQFVFEPICMRYKFEYKKNVVTSLSGGIEGKRIILNSKFKKEYEEWLKSHPEN